MVVVLDVPLPARYEVQAAAEQECAYAEETGRKGRNGLSATVPISRFRQSWHQVMSTSPELDVHGEPAGLVGCVHLVVVCRVSPSRDGAHAGRLRCSDAGLQGGYSDGVHCEGVWWPKRQMLGWIAQSCGRKPREVVGLYVIGVGYTGTKSF